MDVPGPKGAASRVSSAQGLRGTWSLVTVLGLVAVLGGIGGTVGTSGYLWATNCLGFHGNEGYAPLIATGCGLGRPSESLARNQAGSDPTS